MIKEEFYYSVENFKRGRFEKITLYDERTESWIHLHKKQIKALELLTDNVTKHVGYGGAARGGKSLLLVLWQLLGRFAYPNTRGLIGRSELTNLERTTLKTFKSTVSNYGFREKVDYIHNKQKNFISFPTVKSEILLMDTKYKPSDNMLIKYGSLEITDAAVDESNETNYKVIEAISGRVGTWNNVKYGLKGKVFESFNPSVSHVLRRFWLPFEAGEETENKRFVRALPSDNPGIEAQRWLEEKIKDYEAGDMSEAEYQRLILGNFNYQNDPSLLIKYENISKSLYANVKLVNQERYMTTDIAGYGSDWLVIWVWYGFFLMDFKVIERGGGSLIKKEVENLMKLHDIENKNFICDADGIGNIVSGETGIVQGGRMFVNSSRPIWVKNENIANLKAFCAFKFAQRFNSGGYNLSVLKDNPEIWDRLIQEFQALKGKHLDDDFKTRGIITKEEMKNILGFSPDLLDALIMREWFEYSPTARTSFNVSEQSINQEKFR